MCILSILLQTGDINDALIKASKEGCIEEVTVLLDLGADVNYQDEVKFNNKNLSNSNTGTQIVISTINLP